MFNETGRAAGKNGNTDSRRVTNILPLLVADRSVERTDGRRCQPLGERVWLWKSGAIQPQDAASIQNDSFLLLVQFVPAKIHHGNVAQMELQSSLSPS
jgi:hypothetical protein